MSNNRISLTDWQRRTIRQIYGDAARTTPITFTAKRPA